jgi:hypothetical protein
MRRSCLDCDLFVVSPLTVKIPGIRLTSARHRLDNLRVDPQIAGRHGTAGWGQRYYPILIVEKDTLEPVCKPMLHLA